MCCIVPAAVQNNKKGTRTLPACPSSDPEARILAEIPQVFSNRGDIQMVMTELPVAVHQHRNLLAKTPFQPLVAIDVDDRHQERLPGLENTQTGQHVVAEMAP